MAKAKVKTSAKSKAKSSTKTPKKGVGKAGADLAKNVK
jgi:hypothetical protein